VEKSRLMAHEFFHVWNGKGFHPQEFDAIDLSRETYTRSIWIIEGLTKYYQYVLMLRSGVIDRLGFRDIFRDLITNFELNPGKSVMSLEDASFLAWFKYPSMIDSDEDNTSINYYNKGAIVGLLLDMKIRSLTGGRKGLDNVFQAMQKNYQKDPGGFSTAGFYSLCSETAGASLEDFFSKYAAATTPLPYAEVAQACGFSIRPKENPMIPDIGVQMVRTTIVNILPGSNAERAGLQKNDRILYVNRKYFSGGLGKVLSRFKAGDSRIFTVIRKDKVISIPVTIGLKKPVDYLFDEIRNPSRDTLRVREAFYLGR
jgi:predicted metalloprotease with PDZ domain